MSGVEITSIVANGGVAGIFAIFAILIFTQFLKYMRQENSRMMNFLREERLQRERSMETGTRALTDLSKALQGLAVEVREATKPNRKPNTRSQE